MAVREMKCSARKCAKVGDWRRRTREILIQTLAGVIRNAYRIGVPLISCVREIINFDGTISFNVLEISRHPYI